MSSEVANQNETTAAPSAEAPAEATEQLSKLMAEGQAPRKQVQQASEAASFALHECTEARDQTTRPSAVRLVVLRVLLVLNLAAMAAVLIVPFGPAKQGEPAQEPGQPLPPPTPAARTGVPVFPDRDYYNHALRLANEGKWVEAADALDDYMRRNPALPGSQRRLIYLAMQHYNTQAGRTAEAEANLASAQALLERSFLPEDLLRGAELAEKGGNGAEMRRNYARFLLLQKSLPAALRERISEAYLKLGDSYRVEADRGERKAEEQQDAQRQKLRAKDGAGKSREGNK